MKFADLHLSEPILRAVITEGYTTATPIQAQTIPLILQGRDVLGCAQTGTGKTAAFALPILQRLSQAPVSQTPTQRGSLHAARCLVLAPTRELASQISQSFTTYGRHLKIRQAIIYGGVNQNPQVQSLRRGVDIIVATPGRLLDLMNQGHVNLTHIETLVLDEADRMLDMGFMPDIQRITAALPDRRQTLLFSATVPPGIRRLIDTLLHDPAKVQVAAESATADRIEQSVYHVDRRNKPALLVHLLQNSPVERAIVFTRTKHGADRVARDLRQAGTSAESIHGDKTQNARARALSDFRGGKVHVLVATDIAARGIDVDGISHVFNYDISRDPESHVHRIGRTARAGASGKAISFCDHEERPLLRAIQRLIRCDIQVCEDHPVYSKLPPRVAYSGSDQPAHSSGNGSGFAPRTPRGYSNPRARQSNHSPQGNRGQRRRGRGAGKA